MTERTAMNKECVSVIIPVYNSTMYIGEAIESVLKQSFEDYEIIIIDDGSTEDIKGAIHRFLDEYDNIRLVRQNNLGPGPARNTGIRLAKGKWIAFLDADDVWLPEKLEKQIAYLKKYPDALVSGGRQELDCTSGQTVLTESKVFFKNFAKRAETLTYLLEVSYFCPLSSLVMKKKYIEDVGMFDKSLATVEDDDLIFRLVRKHPFYCISDVVVLRRKHKENMTTCLALEARIKNKYKVTKKILTLVADSELIKRKTDILGHWTEEFIKRHIYWKNYGYALKWLLTGIVLYPQYYLIRIQKKAKKIITNKRR